MWTRFNDDSHIFKKRITLSKEEYLMRRKEEKQREWNGIRKGTEILNQDRMSEN